MAIDPAGSTLLFPGERAHRLQRAAGAHRGPRVAPTTLALAAWGVALLAAGLLYLHVTRTTTFAADEWEWALSRRGSSLATFLDTHNGHFSLVPVAVYKLLWALAGLRTYTPYRVLVVALHLACSTLVFAYARRRVGEVIALAAGGLILFFGPGWQDFLWPFQIAWLISVAAGLGALMLLDRGERRGDAGACALLACAVASSGVGLAVVAGVAVEVLARRGRWRRVWVVAVPLALYVLWWIAYQQTTVNRYTVSHTPAFVLTLIRATLAAVAGLWSAPAGTALTSGLGVSWAVLAVAMAAAGWRLARVRSLWPRLLALATIAVAFAVAAGVARAGLGSGLDSRYLYVEAVFIVLAAVELARGSAQPRALSVLVAVLAAAAAISNLGPVRNAGAYLRASASLVRADLGALDIGRGLVGPGYVAAHFPAWPFVIVRAGPYFAAERALGSPAATPAQLRALPDAARAVADQELLTIHQVRLTAARTPAVAHAAATAAAAAPAIVAAVGGSATTLGTCVRFVPALVNLGPARGLTVTLPPGGLRISAGGGVTVVYVRRFATALQPVGLMSGAAVRRLAIGPDRADQPWQVRVVPGRPVAVCALG